MSPVPAMTVGALAPLHGWTMHHHEGPPPRSSFEEVSVEELNELDHRTTRTPPQKEDAPRQMSWLDELPAPPEEDDDTHDH